jgi:hypothetical protein
MFGNNKGPGDEPQSGHKKSASIRSENFPDETLPNPGEVGTSEYRREQFF